MARLEGFEPPTNGFGSHYSIRLSYRRVLVLPAAVRTGVRGAADAQYSGVGRVLGDALPRARLAASGPVTPELASNTQIMGDGRKNRLLTPLPPRREEGAKREHPLPGGKRVRFRSERLDQLGQGVRLAGVALQVRVLQAVVVVHAH